MENEKEQLIDRTLYKRIKAMNRTEMEQFVQNVYAQGYGAAESQSIDYDSLKADIATIKGIGESRLQQIIAVIDKHIANTDDERG
ncbi:hypothetical protein [Ruminococcus albus]|uniref:Uncharacterized protein n=1 Tax=Ruminococcus albus (strain ATCC 27210 / DSM 20455 / JCM 14654 / NCDO 2250 / 7) TaxID=697329 RepID=E6UKP1_RUMA7|nr:hypothetical protein [Ruminococcus albus]ADU24237.1 hypothetical protein Rumal_3807 [Ruminococcus albus 7 = DSM 20455]